MDLHLLMYTHPEKLTAVSKIDLDLLMEAAKKRKHTLEVIFARDYLISLGGTKPEILVNDERKKIKCLITRPNFLYTNMEFRCALIKQFELAGVTVINRGNPVLHAKSKLRTLQILNKKRVPVPRSFIVANAENIDEVSRRIGYFPIIAKTLSGSHGSGVVIVESKRALRSVTQMMTGGEMANPIMVQEYIKEAKGKDLRVFVVGRKIVGVMERIAQKKGEFRSNFHLGGRVRVAEMSEQEKKVAFSAVRALDLDVAGVDIIRTNEGPKVLEVNSNPGLEGITIATGRDIAGKIIEYAVKKVKATIKK